MQTQQEKLRLIADALDAGETLMLGPYGNVRIGVAISNLNQIETLTRIPKPVEQIKVGNRMVNAPLRVMPEDGEEWWSVDGYGAISRRNYLPRERFNNANCWASEDDAKAYAEAALAVRKGEV